MADNETRARIILEADKGSANATRQLLQGISSDLKDLGGATDPLAGRFARLSKSIEGAKVEQFNAAAAAQDYARNQLKAAQAATRMEEQSLLEAKALKEVAAAEKEVNAARAGGESSADTPGGQTPKGGGDGRNFLTRFGSNLRNLPSQQIPGLGIGTDAVGNFARLGGAALDAAKAAGVLSAAQSAQAVISATLSGVSSAVTGALTGQTSATAALAAAGTAVTGGMAAAASAALAAAAGVASFVLSLGPIALVGAIVAVALGGIALAAAKLASDAQKANADLADAYKARRAIQDFVRGGATSEEAKARLAETQQLLEDEQRNLAEAKASYAEAFNAAANSIPILGDLLARIADLFGAFGATKDEIKTAEEASKDAGEEIRFLNAALEQGKFAAADRKEAEEKAAEEAEKAAREAEAHAEKLADAQERIVQSDAQYALKIEDNARAHGQKMLDIQQGFQDRQTDISRKYQDDLNNIALKEQRAESDARLKIQRSEADAVLQNQIAERDSYIKHARNLDDIRKDGLKTERDNLRERNFLAAANASESVKEQIDDANLAAQREAMDRALKREAEAQERAINYAREAQDRQTAQARERDDRLRAFDIENRDARIQLQRQERDAETAYGRQTDMARLQYNREQEQLQAHYNQLLGIAANGQAAERALRQGASAEQVLRSPSNTTSYGNQTSITDNRSLTFAPGSGGGFVPIQQFVRSEMISFMKDIRYKR